MRSLFFELFSPNKIEQAVQIYQKWLKNSS